MNYQAEIECNGRRVKTLADILPESGPLRMLIIGKCPAPVSVKVGHYFQGRQGQLFWSSLKEYGILRLAGKEYPDEGLARHGYGITDVVKVPREFGAEPSDQEYRAGAGRVMDLIRTLNPSILLFVYKRVLDKIGPLLPGETVKTECGFDPALEARFGAKVFLMPLRGVGGVEEPDQEIDGSARESGQGPVESEWTCPPKFFITSRGQRTIRSRNAND
jgi:uracil-DNA glycosylase